SVYQARYGLRMTAAPSGKQWTIEAAGWRAVVVEVGGGRRLFQAAGTASLDASAEAGICPAPPGKSPPPWPSRIRDGQYTLAGRQYQLPLTEPAKYTAIHGLASWVRWRCLAAEPDRVTVEHELVPRPGYPWPLRLRTEWSVDGNGLTAAHEA